MSLTLHLIDEVSCKIDGLSTDDTAYIVDKMKIAEKGAYTLTSVKMGFWDGCQKMFNEEGFFSYYQLDQVVSYLNTLGHNVDDLEIDDHRETVPQPTDPDAMPVIKKDYLDEFGVEFREHQERIVNKAIRQQKGIFDAATSSGKTLACAAISFFFDEWLGSLTITTKTKLVNDMAKEYEKLGLDYVVIDAKKTPKKRKELIASHKHIITTRKIAINHAEDFEGMIGVLNVDEAHILGEKFYELCMGALGDCPVRFGMTGTLPEKNFDPLKRQQIFNMIGGDILETVDPGELMDAGYAARLNIRDVKIKDSIGKGLQQIAGENWCWPMEEEHYANCEERLDAIAKFIDENCPRSTMILARPEVARRLADILGIDYIDGDVKEELREEMFEKFENDDRYRLAASFGTTATGVSIDLIYYGVVIDVGENPSVVGQAVGRFMRNRKDVKDSAIVWDIYSDTKFGVKQRQGRMRYYIRRGFDVQKKFDTIEI